MKISLKKARRIEAAFETKLSNLTGGWHSTEKLDAATNKKEAEQNAQSRFEEVETLALELVAGINEIRGAIRKANEESSINSKIQQIADLERQVRVVKFLLDYAVEVEYGPRTQYGRENVSFDKRDASEKRLNELKFKISELKDSTNGQNASLGVELSSATRKVAEELGIPV